MEYKKGLIYSKTTKRNRVEAHFEKSQESIAEADNNSFNLTYYSWGKLEYALR